jgi:hypothetical protein
VSAEPCSHLAPAGKEICGRDDSRCPELMDAVHVGLRLGHL